MPIRWIDVRNAVLCGSSGSPPKYIAAGPNYTNTQPVIQTNQVRL